MKVFVLCPAATISGGPEALHQFAAALKAKSIDASVVYYPHTAPVPDPYRHYNVTVSRTVDTGPDTIVVVPEAATSLAWRFPEARKVVWWLSVDNYFKWRHINPGPSIFDPRPDLFHVCQSHYAHDFLCRQGIRPLGFLTDYVTESVFSLGVPTNRSPVVTYNPKKTPETTQRLMQAGHDWLALEGFSKTQLAAVLRLSRVYVDFGAHPGRDRIPREAALCGCVVITGRRGAAAFDQDIPLPDRFRLDESAPDFFARATALLSELLVSEPAFLAALQEQHGYRNWISENRKAFLDEVERFVTALAPALADI